MPWTRCIINSKRSFLKALEAGMSRIEVLVDSASGEGPLPVDRPRSACCF